MSARPTDQPEWATDATYDATGKAWDGLAPRLEPSAGLQEEGWEPGARPNARFLNWLFGLAFDWLAYFWTIIDSNHEHTYPATKSRPMLVPFSNLVFETNADGTNQWKPSHDATRGPHTELVTGEDDARAWWFVKLPHGSTLQRIDLLYSRDSARATAGDRWSFQPFRRNFDFSGGAALPTVTSLASAADDGGGSGVAYATFSALAEPINSSTDEIYLAITGPNGPGSNDRLLGLLVTFDDVGPRNY